MLLIDQNIRQLQSIRSLLADLPQYYYAQEQELLSNASIGQHVRHVLEFYDCLLKGAVTGTVCYDDRERNNRIESEIGYAVSFTDRLMAILEQNRTDKPMVLRASYSNQAVQGVEVKTTLARELAYVLDHTVHHMAIIKIALMQAEEDIVVDRNFGVAPSTVRNRDHRSN